MDTQMLEHSDEVSGTTILEDGTKLHWTEGRSSWVHIVHPDGTKEEVQAGRPHPLLKRLDEISAGGPEISRQMTEDEEREHGRAFGYPYT